MLKLTSARILQDGLAIRLTFEGGVAVGQPPLNRRTQCGKWDYLPGRKRGCLVSVADQAAEVIGIQAEDWNMPLPWVEEPEAGGSIPEGRYVFLLAIADQDNNEVFTSPPIFAYSGEQGIAIPANGQVKLCWRKPLGPGQTLRVYATTTSPASSSLRCVAEYRQDGATSYTLTALYDKGLPWQPQSVCVTVTALVSQTIPLSLGGVPAFTVTATEGLISDNMDHATEAVFEQPVENCSLMFGTGQLATSVMSSSRTVYLSSSRGNDTTGDGSLNNPFATKGRADQAVGSDQLAVRFCFLRGDIFPYEPWKVAHWGKSRLEPAIYESYWNYSYGTDPGKRPILMDSPEVHPTAPWFQQGENGKAYFGRWPYQYFKGLAFERNTNLPVSGITWPAATANDWIVLSDCTFTNICLVGSYGSAQYIAPVGCMIHRCVVQGARGGPDYEPHVQGMFVAHCGDWLFSQTAFLHNGWKGPDPTNNDVFNHNVYLSSMSRNVVFHSSWSADGCLSGLQLRGGGVVAYSAFTGNPSHLSSNDTHMFYANVFEGVGIYNHIASGTHSFGCAAIHDFNISVHTNGLDQNRKLANNASGLFAFHHDSTGPYVYDHIAVRHETAVDAGGINMGDQIPTKTLDITHNLIVNNPGTGVDAKGAGLRSACVVPGGARAYTEPSLVTAWDYNAYRPSGTPSDYTCYGVGCTSFLAWQQDTRNDQHSIAITDAVAFMTPVNPGYITQCLNAIKTRTMGAWSNLHDARSLYRDYARGYTPKALPLAQDGDFFESTRPF